MIIIGNGRLITRNAAEPYYENGAVVTENELIKETGTTAYIPPLRGVSA